MATSMTAPRFLTLVALLLACICAVPAAGSAGAPTGAHTARTCWSGYSYDGVQSPSRAFGVSATLTLAARSVVANGHVAAWIGVGGPGLGPGGSDEWLQGGIAHDAGGLAVRTQFAGAWQAFDLTRVLRDPAYAIKLRASGFTASSR